MRAILYSHVHLTEVAVAVLDHVGVSGPVKDRHRTAGGLPPHVLISWIQRDRHHVNTQVADQHDACTLEGSLG